MLLVSATSAVSSKSTQLFHLIFLVFIRFLHVMLLLFHQGNVPAGSIFMVSGAICRKQIAVPLRTTSFLFQLQIREQGLKVKKDCSLNSLSSFNYCCLCAFQQALNPQLLQSRCSVVSGIRLLAVGKLSGVCVCACVPRPPACNCFCRSDFSEQTCLKWGTLKDHNRGKCKQT